MELFQNPQTRRLLWILGLLSLVAFASISGSKNREIASTCNQFRLGVENVFKASLDQAVTANAVYVYDFSAQQKLYGRNQDVPLPIASLTKLMTIRVAAKQAGDMQTKYTITDADLAPEGSIGFAAGDQYTIESLITAALVKSSNDAAAALSHSSGMQDQAFFTAMQAEAASLGLGTLSFQSATGLDEANGVARAYGSARDVTFLLEKNVRDFPSLMAHSALPLSVIRSFSGTGISLVTTNEALEKLPLLKGGKTGYTLSAGGNLAVIWQSERGLIGATVLGSTYQGRFSDMIQIADAIHVRAQSFYTIPSVCQ